MFARIEVYDADRRQRTVRIRPAEVAVIDPQRSTMGGCYIGLRNGTGYWSLWSADEIEAALAGRTEGETDD